MSVNCHLARIDHFYLFEGTFLYIYHDNHRIVAEFQFFCVVLCGLFFLINFRCFFCKGFSIYQFDFPFHIFRLCLSNELLKQNRHMNPRLMSLFQTQKKTRKKTQLLFSHYSESHGKQLRNSYSKQTCTQVYCNKIMNNYHGVCIKPSLLLCMTYKYIYNDLWYTMSRFIYDMGQQS